MSPGIEIAAASGFRLLSLETVASTNAAAFEAARAGDPGRLWVTAVRQSQGRGRRGRAWVSEPGNLYASLLLIDPCPAPKLAELPLVCGVALADAVESAAGTHGLISLKWPNDLLIEGAKLSGILLESETLPDGRLALVAGFGVNCSHHPQLEDYPTIDLAALGHRVAPELLFDRLTASMRLWLETWQAGAGFSAVRGAWLKRCVGIGGPVTVRLPERTIAGRFAGLDDDGRLLLEAASGLITISAGDVFFPDNRKKDPT